MKKAVSTFFCIVIFVFIFGHSSDAYKTEKYEYESSNQIKESISLKYDETHDSFSENLVGVSLNGKWGFIDKMGKEVVPLKYGHVKSFHEGLACVVAEDDKCGFIDKVGKEVVPL